MNREFEIYEYIDRYLQGELSEIELQQFKEKLQSDQEFKSIVEAQELAHEVLVYNELSKLKARMRDDLKQTKNGFGNWGKVLVISAVAITGSLLTYTYLHKTESSSEKKTVQQEIKSQDTQQPENQEIKNESLDQKHSIRVPESNTAAPVVKDSSENDIKENHPVENPTEKKGPVSNSSDKEPTFAYPLKEPEISTKVNCDVVHMFAEVRVDYGFKGQEEATIIIDPHSVKGGSGPYVYALDNSDFQIESRFTGIKDGKYQLKIKDHNNCISTLKKEVVVKIPVKEIDEAFVPSQGETWKFPIKENANAEITIVSKAGTVVYSASIMNGHPAEWDGRSNAGVELETGNYYFVIKYSAIDLVKGHISIVR
jgi:hypothetical protein